jgi:hypothetical protein
MINMECVDIICPIDQNCLIADNCDYQIDKNEYKCRTCETVDHIVLDHGCILPNDCTTLAPLKVEGSECCKYLYLWFLSLSTSWGKI